MVVETECGKVLRLTSDHLVFTERGLVKAGTLLVGDVVFTSVDDDHATTKVKSVKPSTSVETYFGLNCRESVVLADGIRTSTFGLYHTIPSWWMWATSKFMGVEKASKIGDKIATWWKLLGLI